MAHFKKFKLSAVRNIINHCNRNVNNPSNKDIDFGLSHLNYSLLPERKISELEYFNSRIRSPDISFWNRSDVVALVGIVIHIPVEGLDLEKEKEFFTACVDFLNNRYGIENAVQAIVHMDEKGKHHLHYNLIPVVPNQNTRRHTKYQVCCSKLLTRLEFQTFHGDLKNFLREHGINEWVISKVAYGAVKENGGRNLSVTELKNGRMDTIQRCRF